MGDLNKKLEEARLDLEFNKNKLLSYTNYLEEKQREIEILAFRSQACNEWIERYGKSIEEIKSNIKDLEIKLEK